MLVRRFALVTLLTARCAGQFSDDYAPIDPIDAVQSYIVGADNFFTQRLELVERGWRLPFFSHLLRQSTRVLHVGCANWPLDLEEKHVHLNLCAQARSSGREPPIGPTAGGVVVDGYDPEAGTIAAMRSHPGFAGCELLSDWPEDRRYDLILAPEVIEHVTNVEGFLGQLLSVAHPNATFLVSAPNAFAPGHVAANAMPLGGLGSSGTGSSYKEEVHPDHVAWYSPFTLVRTLAKGFEALGQPPRFFEVGTLDEATMAYVLFCFGASGEACRSVRPGVSGDGGGPSDAPAVARPYTLTDKAEELLRSDPTLAFLDPARGKAWAPLLPVQLHLELSEASPVTHRMRAHLDRFSLCYQARVEELEEDDEEDAAVKGSRGETQTTGAGGVAKGYRHRSSAYPPQCCPIANLAVHGAKAEPVRLPPPPGLHCLLTGEACAGTGSCTGSGTGFGGPSAVVITAWVQESSSAAAALAPRLGRVRAWQERGSGSDGHWSDGSGNGDGEINASDESVAATASSAAVPAAVSLFGADPQPPPPPPQPPSPPPPLRSRPDRPLVLPGTALAPARRRMGFTRVHLGPPTLAFLDDFAAGDAGDSSDAGVGDSGHGDVSAEPTSGLPDQSAPTRGSANADAGSGDSCSGSCSGSCGSGSGGVVVAVVGELVHVSAAAVVEACNGLQACWAVVVGWDGAAFEPLVGAVADRLGVRPRADTLAPRPRVRPRSGGEAGNREAGNREAGNREAGNREAGNREAGNREAGNREAGSSGSAGVVRRASDFIGNEQAPLVSVLAAAPLATDARLGETLRAVSARNTVPPSPSSLSLSLPPSLSLSLSLARS